MIRILRAFVWLRWRTLINSLERRSSRDALERFSIAIEQLAPTIAAAVMLPSMVALAGLASYTGWSLAQGEAQGLAFGALRFLLLATCALAIAGPIMLPGGDRTNAVRLLLLPIPRGVLYLGHAFGAFADPWVLLAVAIVIGLPLGLAAGGGVTTAAAAVAAGALLIVTLVGIGLAVTSVVHLIVRDRRRGELLTLIVVIVLPMLGLLPALLAGHEDRTADEIAVPREERRTSNIERQVFAAVPSELYIRAVRSGLDSSLAPLAPLAALAGAGAAVHLLAFSTFVRVLGSTATTGPRRTAGGAARAWRIPGLSRPASAIAINQIRLALRTPRGRATLISPIVVFAMFAALTMQNAGNSSFSAPLGLRGGLGLATFSSLVSLLALLPLAMNQFAIDRAGLTTTLLAPIGTMTLLRGKAVGNAVIACIPGFFCFTAAALLFPQGNPALWLCIPLSAAAAYLLVAPVAAILSAIFPRAVDMNSIGRGSNAHGVAGLLGMLAFVAAAAPGAVLALVVGLGMDRPRLAAGLILVWTLVALGIALVLFQVAAGVFERRRENLGLTSQRS